MNKSKILLYTALVLSPLAAMDNNNDDYNIKKSPTHEIKNENVKNQDIDKEEYNKGKCLPPKTNEISQISEFNGDDTESEEKDNIREE